jgi:hypothetical protein
VKEIIMQTARLDNFTGVIPSEGSPRWGAGKVNAYAAVQLALITVGQQEIQNEISWSIYPNPVAETLNLNKLTVSVEDVEIVDLTGKIIRKKVENNSISLQNVESGTYWLRLLINGKIEQQKFIKL